MNTFRLTILASDKPFYSGQCEALSVPSLDGRYGILAHHSNMITAVIPGTLEYRPQGNKNQVVAVSHGLVKIENNDVLVLVDSIERAEDIDADRALHAAEEARELIMHSKSSREHRLAQEQMERALNRLRVKGLYDRFKGLDKKS